LPNLYSLLIFEDMDSVKLFQTCFG